MAGQNRLNLDDSSDINDRIVMLRKILEEYKEIESNLIDLQKALKGVEKGKASLLYHDRDTLETRLFYAGERTMQNVSETFSEVIPLLLVPFTIFQEITRDFVTN